MEPTGSLPCPQQPVIFPYPEPDQSSPHPTPEEQFSISLPSMPVSSKWYLSFMILHRKFICIFLVSIRSKFTAHLILNDSIMLMLFGEYSKNAAPHYAVFSYIQLLPLYFPQYPVLENPQPVSFF